LFEISIEVKEEILKSLFCGNHADCLE